MCEARKFAKSMRKVYSILTNDEQYRRIFEDGGRPLWPFIKDGMFRAFNVQASFHLPDIVSVACHILTIHRPAVIVSLDVADPRTRVYTLLGDALGIPTVQIQPGGAGPEAAEWRFMLGDVVAVPGESSRDALLSHGVPSEKILVTGSPRYDGLIGSPDCEKRALRERFGISPGNRTVVLASSYFLEYSGQNKKLAESGLLLRAMKRAVFMAVAAVPGVSLIVKPHPLENVIETRALVTDHSQVFFAEPGEAIHTLACACDAFFTFGSIATLYPLILGKPTVCPAFPGWMFSDAYIHTGAVMVPRSESDIVAALREIVADGGAGILRRHASQRSEYVASVVRGGGEQGATRRIVDMLKELAQPHRRHAQGLHRAV